MNFIIFILFQLINFEKKLFNIKLSLFYDWRIKLIK